MLHLLDLSLFHMVNQWCGNWALDRIVLYEESDYLLKGGILLAALWWFWFVKPEARRIAARRQIVATLIGVFVTLLLARAIAAAMPMRLRPMYVAGIGYQPPSLDIDMNMENWNSFPSDTAAFFFGLTLGIWRLSRPLGVVAMAYSAVWICIPRVYLGIHYPSDILAGAALGIATVWIVSALMAPGRWLERKLMPRIVMMEREWPAAFYATAFLLAFEMSVLFDDIRDLLRSVLHAFRMAGYGAGGEEIVLLLGAALVLALAAAAWMLFVLLRRRRGGLLSLARSPTTR